MDFPLASISRVARPMIADLSRRCSISVPILLRALLWPIRATMQPPTVRPRASAASAPLFPTGRIQRTNRLFSPKSCTKARARIEQAFGKLKRFKRVAMRCEKTAQNYASFVSFACGLILLKSVHRTILSPVEASTAAYTCRPNTRTDIWVGSANAYEISRRI